MAEKKPKSELPLSLRAGNIQPMEGMAAPKPADYYVNDCAYIGYPLICGQRIFVVADGGEVRYQYEKGAVPAPDPKIDEAFAALHETVGAFVLEGVVVYADNAGEVQGSRAKAANEKEENWDIEKSIAATVCVYRALYLKQDLRQLTESYRHMVASALVKLTEHLDIKIVKMHSTQQEKELLLDGAVIWALRDGPYRFGLDENRQPMVINSK